MLILELWTFLDLMARDCYSLKHPSLFTGLEARCHISVAGTALSCLPHAILLSTIFILALTFSPVQFIDLGACADLRSGTNYVPEESILDLNYCPPEQVGVPAKG